MRSRKPTRLEHYDYSKPGYYFITVCTRNRKDWFGEIRDGKMMLNPCGEIVSQCWHDLPAHYPNLQLDQFVIMPDHIHGIININKNNVGNGLKPFPTKLHGLSEFVRAFKTFSSRGINHHLNGNGRFHWQKSFHDHIIRDKQSLEEIRQYIIRNIDGGNKIR
ncbi:MAG: transposase [Candidatus Omnitrophota bacterium]